jgi:mannose-6-phosphate isomerase-like protein (cupin superfamily)
MNDEEIVPLKRGRDYIAPDGSEIRLLVSGALGGLAHCVLAPGKSSEAVTHRSVEELWYVLEGAGEIWRGAPGERGEVERIRAGDSLRIRPNVRFQFRAIGDAPLKVLIATMPPWPGAGEAVRVPIDAFGTTRGA